MDQNGPDTQEALSDSSLKKLICPLCTGIHTIRILPNGELEVVSSLENAGRSDLDQQIIHLANHYYDVPYNDMMSEKKNRKVCRSRQLGMWLLRESQKRSFPEIGRKFRRHHSTVVWSCKAVDKRRVKDKAFNNACMQLLDQAHIIVRDYRANP